MNPISAFGSHGSCRSRNKCDNRHKNLSLKLDIEYPLQDFGAAGSTHKQVQHTPTIEPTTAVVYNNCENADQKSNKTKTLKFTKKQLEQDLKALKNETAKLNEKIVTLGKSMDMLTEQLKEERNKNAKLAEEFNISLLDDEDYQCSICREVFIKPSLLNCSHMFCEWCIDTWFQNYDYCPTCRAMAVSYTSCLNLNNFIQRRMQLMPAEVVKAYKEKEVARTMCKEMSLRIRDERRRLELITMTLNGRRSS